MVRERYWENILCGWPLAQVCLKIEKTSFVVGLLLGFAKNTENRD